MGRVAVGVPTPLLRSFRTLAAGTQASSLAEFAISLPLLMVLVVGIFDFGAAFNTKQELNNAMREGARFGASLPPNDLSNATAWPTIDAIRYLVDSYLVASRIDDCGLGTPLTPNHPAGTSQWVYTTPCFGSTNLTLTINRGFPTCNLLMASYGTPPLTNAYIPCTQVSIQYPYQWHFNSVITLIVPGASYGPFITIQTDATATNVE